MTEEALAAGYERRIVTVLFADLVGFTALGEQLDPEDVAAIQDRYFAAVRETAERYGGRLEKFIGDAAVAAFGVPRTRDDDAERAVRAGLAIVGAVERLGAELGLAVGELAVRCGVATGEVVHAERGADAGRLTGDTVNTAARLQAAAPPGGVLVSGSTALAVADSVELGPPEALELKGKAEPVAAHLASGIRPERSREAAMGGLRAPTLGRDQELATLSDALDRVRIGRTSERWLIVAPPGTGKTRLLAEVASRAEAEGATLRRARFRMDDPRPFGGLADLVGPVATSDRRVRLRASGMPEGRAGVVAEALDDLAAGSGVEHLDRDAQFAAWLDGLDALADGRGPDVWLVEDVHWAGGDALAFLDEAHDRPGPTGRLVIAATRPSLLEGAPGFSAIEPSRGRYRLDLAGLTDAPARELVRALIGDALPDGLVDRIVQASDGNCLFIEELLRTWISVGVLRPGDGSGWRLEAAAEAVAVPASVQAVYGAQLDDLAPGVRAVARRSAVAGRRFPADALPTLGFGAAERAAALDSLSRRALVAGPVDLPVVGEGYTYRHALLRDAAYASLARAERAALHVALARWLESVAAEQVDEVAEPIGGHYEAALASAPALASEVAPGLGREATATLAAAWLERAAMRASRQAADAAAVDLLRRAIDQTPSSPGVDLARRQLGLGRALWRTGAISDAVAMLERSVAAARVSRLAGPEASAARTILAEAGATLADAMFEQLQFKGAWDLAEGLMAEIGPAEDLETAALLLARARGRAGETNEGGPWVADATEALRIARRTGDRAFELQALREVAAARGEAGLPSIEDWRALGALATELGDRDLAVRAVVNATGYLLDERPGEAVVALAPARAMAEAWGLTERLAWIEYWECEAGLASGDWDRAMSAGLAALDLGERNAYHRVAVRTLSALLPVASLRGDVALVARGHGWYAEASQRSLPESPYGRVLHTAAAIWFGRAGLGPATPPDMASLRDGFALEPSGPAWLAALAVILATWRAAGETRTAAEALALSEASQAAATLASTLVDGAFEVERALIDEASGSALAVDHARLALGPLRRVGADWWISRALRVLERAAAATPAEAAEAVAIERRLGLVAPAV